ncbi:MAG: SusC/RagA family TonB-linked outer membrane protein [Cyclobacteriaceae bacterium]
MLSSFISRTSIIFILQLLSIPVLCQIDTVAEASNVISDQYFNKGLINDPLGLIQGRIPGLLVSKPGGDPNQLFHAQIRGLTTFSGQDQPLIVIDGIYGASINLIDPADIAAMRLIKTGPEASKYGLQGNGGIIEIETKKANQADPFMRYHTSLSLSSLSNSIPNLDASSYKQLNGAIDFGSATNWIDEIVRKGVSQVHNLALGQSKNNFNYNAAINYRSVEGIATNTGYDRLNLRMQMSQKALNDKFVLKLSGAFNAKSADMGRNEVFKYAMIANPTMPVSYDGTAGLVDAGGYSERQIFDFFNPVAIQQQIINKTSTNDLMIGLNVSYDLDNLIEGLSVSSVFTNHRQNFNSNFYTPKTAWFLNGMNRNGLATKGWNSVNKSQLSSRIRLVRQSGLSRLTAQLGHDLQNSFGEGIDISGGNFLTDAFTYNNLGAALDFANGLGYVDSYAEKSTIAGYFAQSQFNYQDKYFLNALIRADGASSLGENNKWGLFPAFELGANLNELSKKIRLSVFQIKGSWSQTGGLPYEAYLSQGIYSPSSLFYYNGSYISSMVATSNQNNDLKWEEKREWNLNANWRSSSSKFHGSIDLYNRTMNDLIMPVNVPVPPNIAPTTHANVGALSAKGVEVSLGYFILNQSDLSYRVNLLYASNQTQLDALMNEEYLASNSDEILLGNPGAPGFGSVSMIRASPGEKVGNIYGPVFDGVDDDGQPVLLDQDGDGYYCQCPEDSKVIGNAQPKHVLSSFHDLKWKNFDVNLFFSGVFGHDLINTYRLFYENEIFSTVSSYNVVESKLAQPIRSYSPFSDLFVEDASYLKLDNLVLGYTFSKNQSSIRIYFAAQNLLTITGYTGVDPSVRLLDDGGFGHLTLLTPGIERRNQYFPSRTFTMGVTIKLE